MRVEELEATTIVLLQLLIILGRTLQQQRVASLQTDLTGLSLNTTTLTGHSHQHHIVALLKVTLCHRMAYQLAAKGDIGRTHLALSINIIDAPHMMVGSSQTMGTLQLQYLIDLTSID